MADTTAAPAGLANAGPAGTTFLSQRVVHLHPSLVCNLACAHCYSSSAPGRRRGPATGRMVDALAVLRDEGYEVVSISGGEPLLVPDLARLVEGASSLGYRVSLVTNGTVPLTPRRRAALLAARVVAVSVDGPPDQHDALRGAGAFRRMESGLAAFSDLGVRFGMTACITATSMASVPWLHDFAQQRGAAQLALRPLAGIGRGTELDSEILGARERARLLLLASVLDDPDGMRVRTDLAPTQQVALAAHALLELLERAEVLPLSDVVNPLVIDDGGRLVPFAYGVDPRHGLGDLADGVTSAGLRDALRRKTGGLQSVIGRALAAVTRDAPGAVDWFACVARASREAVHQGSTALDR